MRWIGTNQFIVRKKQPGISIFQTIKYNGVWNDFVSFFYMYLMIIIVKLTEQINIIVLECR
jgi:hypothetical protein